MPIVAQSVRSDLTKIITKADFNCKVLIADGREHVLNVELVAERLHLPLDGYASPKDDVKLSDAYFAERFTERQSSEYYTRHCKSEELRRRRYEWIM